VGRFSRFTLNKRTGKKMKKILMLLMLCSVAILAGCACNCEVEPIIEANHKLIVPPNFGNMPK